RGTAVGPRGNPAASQSSATPRPSRGHDFKRTRQRHRCVTVVPAVGVRLASHGRSTPLMLLPTMTTTLSAPVAASRVDANELRVTRVRPLRGPNYWRLAPVIA